MKAARAEERFLSKQRVTIADLSVALELHSRGVQHVFTDGNSQISAEAGFLKAWRVFVKCVTVLGHFVLKF